MAQVKTDISIRSLSQELKDERIRPVYVLTGDERYLIDQVRNKLTETIINHASGDFDLVVFESWETPQRVLAALETPPLLSSKKVVIVKESDLFANADHDGQVDLTTLADFACLILIENKMLKSGRAKKHRAALDKRGGAVLDLKKQSTSDLQSWISRLISKASLRITRPAARQIVDRLDHDMYGISDAVTRLVLYAQHEGKVDIDQAMIDHLIPAPLLVRIFDLMDALSQKQPGRAFMIMDELMIQGEAIPKISFMVLRQIRQLMVAKDLDNPQLVRDVLKVPPFVARKLQSQAQRFSLANLFAIHSRGFDYDVDIKRGKIDDKTALFLLVAFACEAA